MASITDTQGRSLEIRDLWDLLGTTVSLFVRSLPSGYPQVPNIRFSPLIRLIRSRLEVIATDLPQHVYVSHVQALSDTKRSELHEAFVTLLRTFESFVTASDIDASHVSSAMTFV